MLKPAQLYKEAINEKYINIWYDMSYMYYALAPGMCTYEVDTDNHNSHSFVSVDKNGNVLGVISYSVNWTTMSANNLGILAFERCNPTYGRDLIQAIEDIFYKYNLNRLTFWCVEDNPVLHSYKRFVQKYGGRENGHERQSIKLIDGKLHNTVGFEIMAEEFKANYKPRDQRKE